jgi:transcriptional regulator with XRE-family HTH domain
MKMSDYAQSIIGATRASSIGLEMDLRINVREFILSKLEETGLSKGQLAAKLNMKPSQLSRILNAEENITVNTIARVYHALNCKPEIKERHDIFEEVIAIEAIFRQSVMGTNKVKVSLQEAGLPHSAVVFRSDE